MTAVLEQYHQRFESERPRMRAAAESGTFGQIIDEMLLPVGPASGQLLNILVKSLKAPRILELGTSYGYSGIWLAEAARATGGRLVTMELSEKKSSYAREMSRKAGLDSFVDFQVGDALELLQRLEGGIDFVLVDLWKGLYLPCFEAFYPKLKSGAIVVSRQRDRAGDGARGGHAVPGGRPREAEDDEHPRAGGVGARESADTTREETGVARSSDRRGEPARARRLIRSRA